MTARVLLDTNVLVYAYDRAAAEKQQRAVQVLDALADAHLGAISTQILAEFFTTVRGPKLPFPLSTVDAAERAHRFMEIWTLYLVTPDVVIRALRGVLEHKMHYWDAQIWAVARLNGIPLVLSEDFSDGSVLDGVRFLNPFLPSFRLSDWA